MKGKLNEQATYNIDEFYAGSERCEEIGSSS